MRCCVRRLVFSQVRLWLAAVLLIPALVLQAQDTRLDETTFWAMLRQTETLLDEVAVTGDFERLRALWPEVVLVQLADGDEVAVYMGWLLYDLSAERIPDLQRQVRALLAYHEQRTGRAADSQAALSALERVLQDERFQYGEDALPEPAPPPVDNSSRGISLPTGLSELLLVGGGIVVVALVLLSLARGLRVQPVALRTTDEGQEPATAEEARELAAESESVQDFRAAIRYLYLSTLLLLDERNVLHYDPTLTNREHLRQVAEQPQLQGLLHPIIETFDRVWYGFAPVDEAAYTEFRQQVERLRRLAS